MEWELSKENVQPLRKGRDAGALNAALRDAAGSEEDRAARLEEQRRAGWAAVEGYTGNDPIEPWIQLIKWTQQAFPAAGLQVELLPLLEKCTRKLMAVEAYKTDARYLRVWIQYADCCPEPRDIFNFLAANEIGQGFALFYEAHAAFLEIRGAHKAALEVYELGIARSARPVERLRAKLVGFQQRMVLRVKREQDDAALGIVPAGGRPAGGADENARAALAALTDRPTVHRASAAGAPPAPLPTRGRGHGAQPPLPQRATVGLDIWDEASAAVDVAAAAAPGPWYTPAAPGAWATLSSQRDTRKENVAAAAPWAGVRLDTARVPATSPAAAPLDVFEDDDLAATTATAAASACGGLSLRRSRDGGPSRPQNAGALPRANVTASQAPTAGPPLPAGAAPYPPPAKGEVRAYHEALLVGDDGAEACFEEARAVRWRQENAITEAVAVPTEHDAAGDTGMDATGPASPAVAPPPSPVPPPPPTPPPPTPPPTARPLESAFELEAALAAARRATVTAYPPPTAVSRAASPTPAAAESPLQVLVREDACGWTGDDDGEDVITGGHHGGEDMTLHTARAYGEVMSLLAGGGTRGVTATAAARAAPATTSGGDDDATMCTRTALADAARLFHAPTAAGVGAGAIAPPSAGSVPVADVFELGCWEDGEAASPGVVIYDEGEGEGGAPQTASPPFGVQAGGRFPSPDTAPTGRPSREASFASDAENVAPGGDAVAVAPTPTSRAAPGGGGDDVALQPLDAIRLAALGLAPGGATVGSTASSDSGHSYNGNDGWGMAEDPEATWRAAGGDVAAAAAAAELENMGIWCDGDPAPAASLLPSLVGGVPPTPPPVGAVSPVDLAKALAAVAGKCDPPTHTVRPYAAAYVAAVVATADAGGELSTGVVTHDCDDGHAAAAGVWAATRAARASSVPIQLGPSLCYMAHRMAGSEGGAAACVLAATPVDDDDDSPETDPVDDFGSGGLVALKVFPPPTGAATAAWEYVAARRAGSRAGPGARRLFLLPTSLHLLPDGAALLSSPLASCGTLQDALNAHLGAGSHLEEPLVMYLAAELLRCVEASHAAGMLHGDIKPDNIVLRDVDAGAGWSDWSPDRGGCWVGRGVALLDWGRAVDIRCLPPGTGCLSDGGAAGFKCPEVRDGRPWVWQPDAAGIAGTLHCLLHGSYMELECSPSGYAPRAPLKRYWQRELWGDVFGSLLNPTAWDAPPPLARLRSRIEDHLVEAPGAARAVRQQVMKLALLLSTYTRPDAA